MAAKGRFMATQIVRLVTRDSNGCIRTRDFDNAEELLKSHEQIGIDDCSTDLSLRGLPVFRGLVGPIPEARGIARYETSDVFESLTKEWARAKVKRRRRSRKLSAAGIPMVDGLENAGAAMSSMRIS
jgi:hypothetical protein